MPEQLDDLRERSMAHLMDRDDSDDSREFESDLWDAIDGTTKAERTARTLRAHKEQNRNA